MYLAIILNGIIRYNMDFRLRVFVEVARRLSFTRAAKELFISQPAISKHIQELESLYKIRLFERCGSRIRLTREGELFYKHAREILDRYDVLQYEMELLSGHFSGELRIGASTTIAQYLISPLIAEFISRFPEVRITLFSGNTEQIEEALEEHRIDMGLVEGNRKKTGLRYEPFADDELVLVTSTENRCPDSVEPDRLRSLPLVLRENGSGTLQVIESALATRGIHLSDLNILLQMGNTEGIKRFLLSAPGSFAVLSIISVLKELKQNELKVIDIDGLEIGREFVFVSLQGEQNAQRIGKFMNFARVWYKNSPYR